MQLYCIIGADWLYSCMRYNWRCLFILNYAVYLALLIYTHVYDIADVAYLYAFVRYKWRCLFISMYAGYVALLIYIHVYGIIGVAYWYSCIRYNWRCLHHHPTCRYYMCVSNTLIHLTRRCI